MAKRIAFAVLIALAVLTTGLRVPAQACALSMPAQVMNCTADCCAKMKDCVLPQKEQAPAAAVQITAQQAVALIAPAIQPLVFATPLTANESRSFTREIAPESAPRRALLCTFLI